jgi:hypothetical protein
LRAKNELHPGISEGTHINTNPLVALLLIELPEEVAGIGK